MYNTFSKCVTVRGEGPGAPGESQAASCGGSNWLNFEEWTGWAFGGGELLELLSRAVEMVRPEF